VTFTLAFARDAVISPCFPVVTGPRRNYEGILRRALIGT